MAKRGTYAKTAARREEILGTALSIIAENGYSKATLKEVAEAVGLSQMGVLHHFGSKEELFVAVLQRRDARSLNNQSFEDIITPAAISNFMRDQDMHVDDAFRQVTRENSATPGLIQLFTRLLAEATESDHSAHDYFQQRIELLKKFIRGAVEDEKAHGYIDKDVDADKVAVSFIALMDGLQTLWLYNPEINMEEHIEFFWKQVSSR